MIELDDGGLPLKASSRFFFGRFEAGAGAQRGIDQVVRVHAGGRHRALRACREAGRCDSSAPRSCRSGRRGGTDRDCGGDRAIRAGAGRAGDRGGDYRAGRADAAPGAAAAPAFERRRRGS